MPDRYERGCATLETLVPGGAHRITERLAAIAPDLGRYAVEFPFGDIYARPALDLKSRQLATVAALTALGTAGPQLRFHIEGALNVGWSRTEIVEVMIQMAVYAGFPAALNGLAEAEAVFGAAAERVQS